jgi:hypothetical protein
VGVFHEHAALEKHPGLPPPWTVLQSKETNGVQDPARRFKNNFTWINVHKLKRATVELRATVNLEKCPALLCRSSV